MNPVQIERSIRANLARNTITLQELREIMGDQAYHNTIKKLPKDLQEVLR